MQSASQAYGRVAKQVSSPRELESSLLLKAAAQLQSVKEGWDASRPQLDEALLYNRKLWSIFIASVVGDDNPLPIEIRQNVANLGIFVLKQTMALVVDPKPEHLNALISINRELAAGLAARA